MFPPNRSGKVRDLYYLGDRILFVASDRLSAFDVILPTPFPGKGILLTQISLHWFKLSASIVPNHVLSTATADLPEQFLPFRSELDGRIIIGKKLKMLPIECVVRGYLSGSGWKDYKAAGAICGNQLPPGLRESDRLPAPIFTPASKAQTGHDENITEAQAEALTGADIYAKAKEASLALYTFASDYLLKRGIILADTKFEFGLDEKGKLVLGDEILTPDSSRFWPGERYRPGGPQESFDKQYVRDYLETLDWDKKDPGPIIPKDIVDKTLARYRRAYEIITA